jgi:uncharacterized protein YgiM (DUF1202 family)
MAKQKTTYTVNVERGLNVRERPTKESKVLSVLKHGEKVKLDPDRDIYPNWLPVLGGGYVMTKYLK